MAVRYYLTKVIGDGLSPATAWRPKTFDVAEANNVKGFMWPKIKITRNWCVVKVDVPDHTALLADADTNAFPNIALGNTLTTNQRNTIITALTNRGIDTTFMNSVVTFRDLLKALMDIVQDRSDSDPTKF